MSKGGDGRDTYSYTVYYVDGKHYSNRAYFQSKDAAWRVFWSLVVAKRIAPYKTGWRVLWV